MGLEEIVVFKRKFVLAYKLYLSHRLDEVIHKQECVRQGRKEVQGQNPTFRDQTEEDAPAKEEWPMR